MGLHRRFVIMDMDTNRYFVGWISDKYWERDFDYAMLFENIEEIEKYMENELNAELFEGIKEVEIKLIIRKDGN
jgi:hypothetical protein